MHISNGRPPEITIEDVKRAFGQLATENKAKTLYAIHKITGGARKTVKRYCDAANLVLDNQKTKEVMEDKRLMRLVELVSPVVEQLDEEHKEDLHTLREHHIRQQEEQKLMFNAERMATAQTMENLVAEKTAALEALANMTQVNNELTSSLSEARELCNERNELISAMRTEIVVSKKIIDERLSELKNANERSATLQIKADARFDAYRHESENQLQLLRAERDAFVAKALRLDAQLTQLKKPKLPSRTDRLRTR